MCVDMEKTCAPTEYLLRVRYSVGHREMVVSIEVVSLNAPLVYGIMDHIGMGIWVYTVPLLWDYPNLGIWGSGSWDPGIL